MSTHYCVAVWCASLFDLYRSMRFERSSLSKRPRHPTITLEMLQSQFFQPAKKAALNLGVPDTRFRKACRKVGILRWPYRKVRELLKRSRCDQLTTSLLYWQLTAGLNKDEEVAMMPMTTTTILEWHNNQTPPTSQPDAERDHEEIVARESSQVVHTATSQRPEEQEQPTYSLEWLLAFYLANQSQLRLNWTEELSHYLTEIYNLPK